MIVKTGPICGPSYVRIDQSEISIMKVDQSEIRPVCAEHAEEDGEEQRGVEVVVVGPLAGGLPVEGGVAGARAHDPVWGGLYYQHYEEYADVVAYGQV